MSLEQYHPIGVAEGIISSRDNNINPTRQSFLLRLRDEQVAIVRPLGVGVCGISDIDAMGEFERRKSAISWHERNLPDYTLPNQLILIESDSKNGESLDGACLLCRVSPEIDNVINIGDLPEETLETDEEIVRAITEITAKQLKAFLFEGKIIDCGTKRLKKGDQGLLRRYTIADNIMIGRSNGERKIFCDPDWYLTFGEYFKPTKSLGELKWRINHLVKQFGTLFKRFLAFKSKSLIGNEK